MRLSKHAAARPYVAVMAKTAMPTLGGRPLLSPEGMKSLGEGAWKGLQLASVAMPLVTATAAGASALYDKMTAASRKAQAFKTMVAENPHLQDRDPVLVQRYFNTLHNLNPQLAHDPTVAASFVNNMVMTGTNPSMPHRDIFAQALQLQRGGGSSQGGGGLEAAKGISDALMGVHRVVSDKKLENLQGQLSDVKAQHGEQLSESKKRLEDAMHRARVNERWRQMSKRREQGAQQRAGDADYYESLLQQHGIQY